MARRARSSSASRSTSVAEVLLEQLERIEAADRADGGRPGLGGQLVAVLVEQLAPGAVGRALGLEHRAVEVEQDGADGRQIGGHRTPIYDHPMDLCLMIEGQEGVSWPEWVALAQGCEAHGVPALFRSDHHLNLDGEHPDRGSLDAWATLAALGAVTTSGAAGHARLARDFRHPSTLAKAVVAADHAPAGASSSASAPAGTSASTRPTASTSRRSRSAWTGSRSSSRSSTATGPTARSRSPAPLPARDLDAQPKPLQRPHPPLLMGGAPDRARRASPRARPTSTTP